MQPNELKFRVEILRGDNWCAVPGKERQPADFYVYHTNESTRILGRKFRVIDVFADEVIHETTPPIYNEPQGEYEVMVRRTPNEDWIPIWSDGFKYSTIGAAKRAADYYKRHYTVQIINCANRSLVDLHMQNVDYAYVPRSRHSARVLPPLPKANWQSEGF